MGFPHFTTKRPSTPRQRRLYYKALVMTGVGLGASMLIPLLTLRWLNIPTSNTQAHWIARLVASLGFALTLSWGFDRAHRIVNGEFDPPGDADARDASAASSAE